MVESDNRNRNMSNAHFSILIDKENKNWNDDFVQMICYCGCVLKKPFSGYTNMIYHIKHSHTLTMDETLSQYMANIDKSGKTQTSILDFGIATEKAKKIFGYLEWTVEDNLPFAFVSKANTRKYCTLGNICVNTLMKYLELVALLVEEKIKTYLKDYAIGLMLDGWTESGTHYCVLFACLNKDNPSEKKRIMLSFAPLLDETSQSADSHVEWIQSVLTLYDYDMSNLLFFCSDNTNTMPSVANKLYVPFIGCSSHKLALYVKAYLGLDTDDEDALNPQNVIYKIKRLMTKMRSANKRGVLRQAECNLVPEISNLTRWSSSYNMMVKYMRMKPFIDHSDRDLRNLTLSHDENDEVEAILPHLKDLNDVTVALQGEDITLCEARLLLDAVIELNLIPDQTLANRWLSKGATITTHPSFESGLRKISDGKEATLNFSEKHAVQKFLKNTGENNVETNNGNSGLEEEVIEEKLASKVFNKDKMQKTAVNPYMSCDFVPATSCLAERAFSISGFILSNYRKSMTPFHLECLVFLKFNRDMWDVNTVQQAINKHNI